MALYLRGGGKVLPEDAVVQVAAAVELDRLGTVQGATHKRRAIYREHDLHFTVGRAVPTCWH